MHIMNRELCRYISLLCCIIMLATSGCQSKEIRTVLYMDRMSYAQEIFGVVRTSGQSKNSGIDYYNQKLQHIGSTTMALATIGDTQLSTTVVDNAIYLTSQGYAFSKRETRAVQIKPFEQASQIIDFDLRAQYAICAGDQFIITGNNLNFDSHIRIFNSERNSFKTIVIPDLILENIFYYKKKIYAFFNNDELWLDEHIKQSVLKVYDTNGSLLNTVDTTEIGSDIYNAEFVDDVIYFLPRYTKKESPNNAVGVYDITNNTLSSIKLKRSFLREIVKYRGMLYISHFFYSNDVTDMGWITSIDISTGNQKLHKFTHPVEYMAIQNDKLAVYGNNTLYMYNVGDFSNMGSVLIPSRESPYFSYITGLVALKNS